MNIYFAIKWLNRFYHQWNSATSYQQPVSYFQWKSYPAPDNYSNCICITSLSTMDLNSCRKQLLATWKIQEFWDIMLCQLVKSCQCYYSLLEGVEIQWTVRSCRCKTLVNVSGHTLSTPIWEYQISHATLL